MLIVISENWTKGEHVEFLFTRPSESGKTKVFRVNTINENITLGEVRWYAPWRKYAFYPEWNTLYEERCLRDIADFVGRVTIKHRAEQR